MQTNLTEPPITDQRCIESQIINRFAWTTASGSDALLETIAIAYADRYGTCAGTNPQGGSGRAVCIGGFNVKGVGPTPLVGRSGRWVHNHGMVGLSEAILEVVYSEIMGSQLPWGAIPIIAVIDLQHCIPTDQDSLDSERRVLLVRPATLRPAHFMRAPAFAPAAISTMSSPGNDASRIRELFRQFFKLQDSDLKRYNFPPTLKEMCCRLAEQAGYGDSLRLFTGGLFEANVSITGEILDFGAAWAPDNWAHLKPYAHTTGFGNDINHIMNTAIMMTFYAHKCGFGNHTWLREAVEFDELRATHSKSFLNAIVTFFTDRSPIYRVWILAASQHLYKYFEYQQKFTLREPWTGAARTRLASIIDLFTGSDWSNISYTHMTELNLARAINRCMPPDIASNHQLIFGFYAILRRFIDTYPYLSRYSIKATVSSWDQQSPAHILRGDFCDFINKLLQLYFSQDSVKLDSQIAHFIKNLEAQRSS